MQPQMRTAGELAGVRSTLSVSECASEIGIGRNQAYQLISEGVIPHLRLGKRIVVPRLALDRWLASAGRPEERGATR